MSAVLTALHWEIRVACWERERVMLYYYVGVILYLDN